MSAAFGTGNFRPLSVRIHRPLYSPFNFIIETGPAAMRIKFISRAV